MKKIASLLYLLLVMISVTSCAEDDYYDSGEDDIIYALTSVRWLNSYMVVLPDGSMAEDYSIWNFDPDGRGYWTTGVEYEDGYYEEDTYYFRWGFTNPTCSVIYMNIQVYGDCYWLIDTLSPDWLGIWQAPFDPVMNPGIDRTFYSFEAIQK